MLNISYFTNFNINLSLFSFFVNIFLTEFLTNYNYSQYLFISSILFCFLTDFIFICKFFIPRKIG